MSLFTSEIVQNDITYFSACQERVGAIVQVFEETAKAIWKRTGMAGYTLDVDATLNEM